MLLDCPPSLGVLTVAALTAAEGVLIPLQCETLSHRGVGQLLDTVHDVRRFTNRWLEVWGVLPTLYDGRTNHARTVLETISDTYELDVIEPPIPKTIKFAEAPAAGRSILATSRSSKGAKAYREVAANLVARARREAGEQRDEQPTATDGPAALRPDRRGRDLDHRDRRRGARRGRRAPVGGTSPRGQRRDLERPRRPTDRQPAAPEPEPVRPPARGSPSPEPAVAGTRPSRRRRVGRRGDAAGRLRQRSPGRVQRGPAAGVAGRRPDVVRRTYLVSGSIYDNLDPGTYSVYSRSQQAWGIDDSGHHEVLRPLRAGRPAPPSASTTSRSTRAPVQTVAELGTPLSHGCIRQKRADARAMWEFAPLGTTVVVTA